MRQQVAQRHMVLHLGRHVTGCGLGGLDDDGEPEPCRICGPHGGDRAGVADDRSRADLLQLLLECQRRERRIGGRDDPSGKQHPEVGHGEPRRVRLVQRDDVTQPDSSLAQASSQAQGRVVQLGVCQREVAVSNRDAVTVTTSRPGEDVPDHTLWWVLQVEPGLARRQVGACHRGLLHSLIDSSAGCASLVLHADEGFIAGSP